MGSPARAGSVHGSASAAFGTYAEIDALEEVHARSPHGRSCFTIAEVLPAGTVAVASDDAQARRLRTVPLAFAGRSRSLDAAGASSSRSSVAVILRTSTWPPHRCGCGSRGATRAGRGRAASAWALYHDTLAQATGQSRGRGYSPRIDSGGSVRHSSGCWIAGNGRCGATDLVGGRDRCPIGGPAARRSLGATGFLDSAVKGLRGALVSLALELG